MYQILQQEQDIKIIIIGINYLNSNNYLCINEEYDAVNKSMYFDNLDDVKQYANEIICFYSDNDSYVKYETEKDFANKIATEQILIPNGGNIKKLNT